MLSKRYLLSLLFLLFTACSKLFPVDSSDVTSGAVSLSPAPLDTTPNVQITTTSLTTILPTPRLASQLDILSTTKVPLQSQIPAASPSQIVQSTLQEEAILILSPGPGSRLTNPVHVSGMSDPTFEQTLAVRLVAEDGTILANSPAKIDAAPGKRGQFKVDLRVEADNLVQAVLEVYTSDPRDGGITHLSSAVVTYAPSGAPNILPLPSQLERIIIRQPLYGSSISNGLVHIEGFGLASFEQTLLAEVIGPDGMIAGKQPLIVAAPDIGKPGAFQTDVNYAISAAGPGRIVIHDPIPIGTGDAHISSVEVNLSP
jgi:hypothetical protein